MISKSLLSLDIWHEILSYFEVSLEDDDEKLVREKRKAMFAIALLSPKLTELALDALWKNMTTLVPIVNIVNSDDERLGYHISNGRGCWRASICYGVGGIERSLDDLIKHLKRVRGLRVKVSEKELELWQMLHTLLMPRSMVYLLPCLQRLSLVSADDPQSHPFLAVISYIFAPSLTSVRVEGCWGSSWNTVQHFMNSHRTPNLSQLHYLDETLDGFLCGVGHLTSLRCLTLHEKHRFYPFSIFNEFVLLSSLQKLAICIQMHDDDRENSSTKSLTLPELQHLQLKIGTAETYDPFFRQMNFPSLITLSLDICHALTQEPPLRSIIVAYPNLLHLTLHCAKTQSHSYQMTANGLMSIANVCRLQSLKLVNIPHKLRWRDIFSLVKSLPALHSLAIMGLGTMFSAKLLISISQFPSLRYIEFPLDFSYLVDYISSKQIQMSESPSELLKIISTRSKGIPGKSSAKVILVRNILYLFPKLEELGGTVASMEDLRGLFEVVNDMFYKPS